MSDSDKRQFQESTDNGSKVQIMGLKPQRSIWKQGHVHNKTVRTGFALSFGIFEVIGKIPINFLWIAYNLLRSLWSI